MKKIKNLIIPIILIIFSVSCDTSPSYPDVDACFQVTQDIHYVNEPVYFVNCSQNVIDYEWDFGDGTMSNQRNTEHTYLNPGTYQVRLKTYGYNNSYDLYTHAVTVQGSTDLDILVMYVGTEDPVSNCSVTIFDNEYDWENLVVSNKVDSLVTGSNGVVVFQDLNSIKYYIDAYRAINETSYYSNYLQGYATENLIKDEINAYNIYVEVLYSDSKSKRNKNIIKYIEKSSIAEHNRILKRNKTQK